MVCGGADRTRVPWYPKKKNRLIFQNRSSYRPAELIALQ